MTPTRARPKQASKQAVLYIEKDGEDNEHDEDDNGDDVRDNGDDGDDRCNEDDDDDNFLQGLHLWVGSTPRGS